MADSAIGIDLGTTYSAVAYIDETGTAKILPNAEGDDLTPSVIYFEGPGNIVVGQVAKDARIDEPEKVVEFIKRQMGKSAKFRYVGQEFTATELSGIILQKLKNDAE